MDWDLGFGCRDDRRGGFFFLETFWRIKDVRHGEWEGCWRGGGRGLRGGGKGKEGGGVWWGIVMRGEVFGLERFDHGG